MKKIFTTLFCVIIATTISFSQKQASNWYFGAGIGLNFNSGAPVTVNQAFAGQDFGDTEEGHATVSDENGNFLFYTNGITVWDKNAVAMNNGTGLLGNQSSTQCATIFPLGNSKTKFVVLTTPVTSDYTNGPRYNVVDLDPATNGGFATGSVVLKNQIMPPALNVNVTEALASCPTSTGGSPRWVLAHSKAEAGANGIFYAWKVSADASGNIIVADPVISTIGNKAGATGAGGISIMKFNNCFNKIALTNYDDKFLQVFSFNNATGVVSDYDATNGVLKLDVSLTSGGSVGAASRNYGVEFSPNGRYLFVSQSGERIDATDRMQRLYRYDLQAGVTQALIEASRTTLYSRDLPDDAANNFRRIGHLQLGPDKKIYMTHMGDGINISVIATPDNAAHNFSAQSISWASGRSTMGLPSFDKGLLAASVSVVGSDSTGVSITNLGEICSGISTKFTPTYTGTASTYTWDMNAPAATSPNGGTTVAGVATHKYAAGDYKIILTVVDALCAYTVRDTSTIKVSQITQATGYAKCGTPNIKLNVSNALPGNKYVWYEDAAAKKPFGTGTPLLLPDATISKTYYVKQVDNFVITPIVITPAVPAVPAGPYSISTGINSSASNAGSNFDAIAATPAITFVTVSNPITLTDLKFTVDGSWCGCAPSRDFTVKITNTGTSAVVVNQTNSYNLDKTTSLWSNTYKTLTFTPSPASPALAAGNYKVEIYAAASEAISNIKLMPNTLTTPTISNVISNTGNGASKTFIHDLNINLTTSTAAIAAVTRDSITSSSTACAYTSAVIPVNCSLPVQFVTFSANRSSTGAILNWVTASEKNNDHFDIERSTDGVHFTTVGTVAGAGTKKSSSYYQYTDDYAANGVVYYRIKQVDIDDQSARTDIRSVNYGVNDGVFALVIAPNPSNGNFKIRMSGVTEPSTVISIFDVFGNVVWTQSFATEGNFETEVSLAGVVARGLYFVKVGSETKKIVID